MSQVRIQSLALFAGAVLLASFARAEQVVFTEVMYHPPGELPEYVEVYNQTSTPLDMAQWRLRGGVSLDFPAFSAQTPSLTFLKPYERILLSNVEESLLRAAYTIPPNIRIFGPWSGRLNNAGDTLELKDKNGVNLCRFSYKDGGRWPVAADGAGHSLVLIDSNRPLEEAENWTFSTQRLGTPGSEPITQAETPVTSPEINLDEGLPYVSYGDTWRYHDQNIDLGTEWRTFNYDDSDWPSGPGLFGFENAALPSPGIRTALSDLDQLTYYLRTRFVYQGPTNGVTLAVDQILDDGAVYYLNGELLGQSGTPAAASVTFNTPANRTVPDATEELNVLTAPGTRLRQGTNVLAVEVHQVNNSSSDVVFGARLKISSPRQRGLVINEILPGTPGKGFIEFFNPGSAAVNLRNHYITDDPGQRTKHQILTDVLIPPAGFATVGYSESGLGLSGNVKAYLVAPDGNTIIHAIGAAMPLDGRSLGRKPAGGNNWFLFTLPSPGRPNASSNNSDALVRLNEIHFSTTNTIDWVELKNAGNTIVDLNSLSLADNPDLTSPLPLSGNLAPGAIRSLATSFPAPSRVALFLFDSQKNILWAHSFNRSPNHPSIQAYPEGSDEWYHTTRTTQDLPNNPERNTDVVLNEVMYDPPSNEPGVEFIEIHNRGTNTLNLEGWRISDGVNFTFPPGSTLAAGGYAVVVGNADRFAKAYPGVQVVGSFDGQLANKGERIRILDSNANLVDQVQYRGGGSWPRLANGDGTSMELRNPWMDNALASAWDDSNETNKTAFERYTYSGLYSQLRADGAVTDHKELHLHLVGDSHVVLRNIQLRLNGTGPNLLLNNTTMSTDGRSSQGWLAQGTHYASQIRNGELHLIADGHGDNRPNRVELDAIGLTSGQRYEISFEARWVAGASRLIVQTWDHSLATTFSLKVPDNLGTPGQRNSAYIPKPAAQIDGLLHQPAVPSPGQPVTITAQVHSFAPGATVTLFHRPDNVGGNAAWQNKPMFDDGIGGNDEIAGDGLYSAELTEYGAQGQVVQFYATAASEGYSSQTPPNGAARPGMYVVDTPSTSGDLRRMRFVLSALDLQTMADGDGPTPPYGYAFPRLQNHYFNMTLIRNERDIVYDCEIRNSGSPWTRGGDLSRGKFKLPRDQTFRGKEKLSYDNDAGGGARHHNRISRYWLYLLGHPANENEYVLIEVNANGQSLREEVEPLGNDLLDRVFENGSQGELYRIDDEWWFADDWSRSQRDADWSYKGTDNPTRYHSEWMKRTRENDYDYSSLISMFRKVNTSYTQGDIDRILDAQSIADMAAVRGYTSDWDSFSMSRGKNGYLYRKSTDGRFMFFHWDSDLAFGDPGSAFYGGMAGFRGYLEKPYVMRLLKRSLATLLDSYTSGSPRMAAWLQAEEEASSQYTVSSLYATWFANRAQPASTFLGTSLTSPFSITSNSGNPFNTISNTVALTGTAPLRITSVRVEGQPNAQVTWTSDINWSLSPIVLANGINTITVTGLDDQENSVLTDSIAITKTGNSPPIVNLKSSPASWRTTVLEPVELDATDSFDPERFTLDFQWNVSPKDVRLDVTRGDRATAYFDRPGRFVFTLTARDPQGATASITREILVHDPSGFSSFDGPGFDSYWNVTNLPERSNYITPIYHSFTEQPGHLLMQISPDKAYPLASASPTHPWVSRTLPPLTDWAFLTEIEPVAMVFGDYFAGILLEVQEGGLPQRYAFGIEDGININARKITAAGASTLLRGVPMDAGSKKAQIRIRREGTTLLFDQELNNQWITVHSAGIPADATAIRIGPMAATDTPQAIKIAFDRAILVNPAALSDLGRNLRISEIMYNPPEGPEGEYVELVNKGNVPLDLTGVSFTDGIEYTFGPTLIQPGQYLIVAKNPVVFASNRNTNSLQLAPGGFLGRLDNNGETIELSDRFLVPFLSVTYGNTTPWPVEADGQGSSIELRNLNNPSNDPLQWRASPEAGGSPGRPGGNALGRVVVNEVLTHTDPPFEDAIELFNTTLQPIDIGGWYLSDSNLQLKKYRIPAGTIVPPLGYHVLYELAFNNTNAQPSALPFSLSSANGDQVILSEADSAGNLTGYRSKVEFGPALNGVPFGRYESSLGFEFVSLRTLTLGKPDPLTVSEFRQEGGKPNSPPLVGPATFNEIFYHPQDMGGTNDNVLDEFIEIHNLTSNPLPLYDPVNPTNTWRVRGGVEYDFQTNIVVPARGFLILVNFNPATNQTQVASYRARMGIPPGVPIHGPMIGKLGNGTDELKLLRPDFPQTTGPDIGLVPYVLIDRVVYQDGFPWPAEADGAGSSLQKRHADDFGNDPIHWKAALPTPGRANLASATSDDSDFDGIPDNLEVVHGLNPADPNDAQLDADQDGRSNRDEIFDGTDPRNGSIRKTAPVFILQPLPQNIASGGTAQFRVETSGTGPVQYQWRLDGLAIPGATNQVLAIPNATDAVSGFYQVVAFNELGFAVSRSATLSLSQALTIITQPQSQSVNWGSTVVFQVVAGGTGTLRYQWRLGETDLPGQINSILSLINVQPSDSGNYSVRVQDNFSSLLSAAATLQILTPPVILEHPQSVVATLGTPVSFTVTALGQEPLQYQWLLNSLPLPDATNSTLTLSNIRNLDAGSYRVVVSNSLGFTTSQPAELQIREPLQILSQPVSTEVSPGATVLFTVSARGSGTLRYQWRWNDIDIPNATNSNLRILSVDEENEGQYVVVVRDEFSSLNSAVATLRIVLPLYFIQPPLAQIAVERGQVTLSAEVGGARSTSLLYLWKRISPPNLPLYTNLLATTQVFLSLTDLTLANSGSYQLEILNPGSSIPSLTSPPFTITVLKDSDSDGIPDSVETALGLSISNPADALQDFDGDGVSNRDEFEAGTELNNPASFLRIRVALDSGLASLEFGAQSNRTYTVQSTDSLQSPFATWQPMAHLVAWPTNHVRTIVDPRPATARFYRVVTPAVPATP